MRTRTRPAGPMIASVIAVILITGTTIGVRFLDSGISPTARWVAPATASGPTRSSQPSGSAAQPSPTTASPPADSCPGGRPWSCEQQRRFQAAEAYLAGRPGKLGIVLGDRVTGAVWRAGPTGNVTWTASTIKLALATALLEEHRAGRITLDATDRANLHNSLNSSSNEATTALWNRYTGPATLDLFRSRYAMASLSVVPGYELFWRHLRCNADDLFNLMSYVLTATHPDDRAYLVKELRSVASNQRWGVWAAGSALQPGNKDGWAQKPDPGGTHWVTHSVGFAGPQERYVVAVTYSLPPSATMSNGIHAVSDLVATVFGAPVPAQVSLP